MIKTGIILLVFIHFKEMYQRITRKNSNHSIQNDKKQAIMERICYWGEMGRG